MKYLKTYESVRDLMKPKSEEEILKSLKNFTLIDQLIKGIKHNMIWVVEDTISKGVLINVEEWDKEKLLNTAVYNKNIKIVGILLDAGIDIHSNFDRALRIACEDVNYEMVKYLLERGADPHAKYDEAIEDAEANRDNAKSVENRKKIQ